MAIETPYYLIDEKKLLHNGSIIQRVRDACGAKSLLALKCFSAWCVFPLMRKYLDGTTSSSLFEVRLGSEKFGGETHAYCVAYTDPELLAVRKYADTIIFNSWPQLRRFHRAVRGKKVGLRINPGVSCSHFHLADPARRHSRLGVTAASDLREALPLIDGCMFHFNCENDDVGNFAANLGRIARRYGGALEKLDWVSLGGGISFTKQGYPLGKFCALLRAFARRFGVQVYLEPGEAAVTGACELVTTVTDIVHNGVDIAIVNASTEAHMLDHLVYRTEAKFPARGRHRYQIAGRSCLAGDIFGSAAFQRPLKVGDTLRIPDAGGYTMVKKNWFNGLAMPSIAVRREDGRLEKVRGFDYRFFVNSLS